MRWVAVGGVCIVGVALTIEAVCGCALMWCVPCRGGSRGMQCSDVVVGVCLGIEVRMWLLQLQDWDAFESFSTSQLLPILPVLLHCRFDAEALVRRGD